MATNEQKGLDALIAPPSFTLGHLARLERIQSPLLGAEFTNLNENLKAICALRMSASEFVKNADNLEPFALDLGDKLTMDEYEKALNDLVEGLVSYGILMPRPDEDAKKKTEKATAG